MKSIVVLLVLVVGVATGKAVEGNQNGAVEESHECHYHNRTYSIGDALPTRHMCLNCTCSNEFVEPNDVHCDVIHCAETNELQSGCQPVFDSNECCPVSWDCKSAASKCQCDQRYFKHYEAKGCSPVFEDGCDCPIKFECHPLSLPDDPNKCYYKGKTYNKGEEIHSSNPCDICSCQDSHSGLNASEVYCISIECPSVFGPPKNSSCKDVYQDGKCCPETICSTEELSERTETVCEYDGKTYKQGERIYPKEDPCKICTCTQDWTGIDGRSCRIHDCMLEKKRHELLDGCVPIYHDSTCCPIEIYCGTSAEGFKNTTVPEADEKDIELGQACNFKGMFYKLGQTLEINHPTNCVTCTCTTPPDFTCIHKTCPGPPNNDYENCRASFPPGQCCPSYDCPSSLQSSSPVPEVQCSPVHCSPNCTEVTVHNSCPFCKCEEVLCVPPECGPDCQLQEYTPPGQCPTCSCLEPRSSKKKRVCAPVVCQPHCHEVISQDNCPMCICGPLCTPPKCEPGYTLERNVKEGECPRCVASKETVTDMKIQCSPVVCPNTCREEIGDFGCPTCICDPLCSPPKCDDGCHVDPNPQAPCPECVCPHQEQVQCAPVYCGPLCHEAYGGSKCPTCVCDPQCAPLHCDPGCRIEYDPYAGPCPACACDAVDTTVNCSPPQCGPGCRIDYSTRPCPSCACAYLIGGNNDNSYLNGVQCSPPKCDDPHCRIDYTATPCPACVCDNEEVQKIQCSPPKCDPWCTIDFNTSPCPSCSCPGGDIPLCTRPKCDENCIVDFSTKPCPSCNCNSRDVPRVLCSPPKCAPGCKIDYTTKPCPSCNCMTRAVPRVLCSPPRCAPGCRVDHSTKPCPSCNCLGRDPARIMCSPPKCDEGCSVDYSSIPCPSCKCPESSVPRLMCSPPKCEGSCTIDYSTQPCPSCKCDEGDVPRIMCSPPKCEGSCTIDYSTQPCPSCKCDEGDIPRIMCSPPKCGPSCTIDYSTKPCPSCKCGESADVPRIMCSPPKCEGSCSIDYSTQPCPSCKCDEGDVPRIMCSPPKCDEGCGIDYSTTPCPSCKCDESDVPRIMCSPPKCDEGCTIDYSTRPCPSCKCNDGAVPRIMCSPPKCEGNCRIDYSTKPCPSCKCEESNAPRIMCSPPRCDESCTIDYSTFCPSCKCNDEASQSIQCSPPKCDPGCRIDYSTKPCPSCSCLNEDFVKCTPPQCGPGCSIDLDTKPCPSCACGYLIGASGPAMSRQMPLLPYGVNIAQDPYCRMLKCAPGCRMSQDPPPPNERCPSCVCEGRVGTRVTCAPTQCELPCRFERFSPYGCPSCICFPIPCTPLNCSPGYVERKFPEERCPRCVKDDSESS